MERSPWAFIFSQPPRLFLPPTPNPLPSGKRALRFASPGFNFHQFYLLPSIPRLYVTLAEKRGSILILTAFKPTPLRWVGLFLLLTFYLGQLV